MDLKYVKKWLQKGVKNGVTPQFIQQGKQVTGIPLKDYGIGSIQWCHETLENLPDDPMERSRALGLAFAPLQHILLESPNWKNHITDILDETFLPADLDLDAELFDFSPDNFSTAYLQELQNGDAPDVKRFKELVETDWLQKFAAAGVSHTPGAATTKDSVFTNLFFTSNTAIIQKLEIPSETPCFTFIRKKTLTSEVSNFKRIKQQEYWVNAMKQYKESKTIPKTIRKIDPRHIEIKDIAVQWRFQPPSRTRSAANKDPGSVVHLNNPTYLRIEGGGASNEWGAKTNIRTHCPDPWKGERRRWTYTVFDEKFDKKWTEYFSETKEILERNNPAEILPKY